MPTTDELRRVLAVYPRLTFTEYPTPLYLLPSLSQELHCEVYVKRDDEIGRGLGGNKSRKLEYLLADAQKRGVKKVVTFGGLQSNHARITAAAANKVGLEPHLFFFERRPARLTGNLLVNQLLGAKMHFISLGGGSNNITIEATIRLVRLVAWLFVGPHYFIPVGGHTWLGCLGYVRAAMEIDEQARALGIPNARLVVAAGSGGTLAGLMAGLALIGSSIKLLGIDVGKLWKEFPESIAHLSRSICTNIGYAQVHLPTQVPLIEETYVGREYGFPSEPGTAAINKLARLEGLLLDPVYTAKAFAGLLDLAHQGKIGQDEAVIFLHTGGLPALFAFNNFSP